MLVSIVPALILQILPLPGWAAMARPDFLVLAVLFWSIMAPRAGGLALAFVCGLLLDLFQGLVLGQHALAACLAAYLAIRLHLRIRLFPIWHQALTVFWLLVLYQFVLFWIDGITGHPVSHWARWLPPFTGALLWPVLAGMLSHAYQRT
jgi:rod shape-determining protein MreD